VRADVPLALLDSVLVTSSVLVLAFVRFNGDLPALQTYSQGILDFLPVILAIHLLANWAWGLYGPIWRHASVAEAQRIVLAGLSAAAAIYVLNPLQPVPMPRSVALIGALGATGLMGLARFQARMFGSRRYVDRTATRVAVVGAGAAGATILREMVRRPDTGRCPVAVVDDNVRKHGRSLMGVPVVGSTARLAEVVKEYGAQEVLVAIPSATQELLGEIMRRAQAADVPVKTLPPVRELLGAAPSVRDVRGVEIDDLLGRTQVPIDVDAVRAAVSDRTVMITGAGGSIGAEIARQVAACQPARLLLIDHDETHLHDVLALTQDGQAALASANVELVLADIRDEARMTDIFVEAQPDLVFHAAAHKHVPLLEAHPAEAVRTNVLGTRNVVAAAAKAGAPRMVFISTDKAVRPVNNLGYSKWIGEQLLLRHMPPGAQWCSVRFGNVLGSRGSVIPTFARQIAQGVPVTVTDPRMTRFFMSVSEAVQLVLQAAVMSEGGETYMLDMGDPVNIMEMAERMVRLSGRQVGAEIPIRFIGCRPGEKLTEDLCNPDEGVARTTHPSIVRLTPNLIPGKLLWEGTSELEDLVNQRRDADAAGHMADLVTEGRAGIAAGIVPDVGSDGPDLVEQTSERRDRWSPSIT
jgi:FlaA1/EpsC-like NDP-sugar epimerase